MWRLEAVFVGLGSAWMCVRVCVRVWIYVGVLSIQVEGKAKGGGKGGLFTYSWAL